MNAFFQELFRADIYKRSQGRITRQVTFAALAITAALGCLRLMQILTASGPATRFAVPAVVVVVCWWLSYRIVNLPIFADFLIAVEAEMNKVSWPTRHELFRASLVVLLTMLLLTAALALFDVTWTFIFRYLKVVA